jgi:hypothetical protein
MGQKPRHPPQTNPKNNPNKKTNPPHNQKQGRDTTTTPIPTKEKLLRNANTAKTGTS